MKVYKVIMVTLMIVGCLSQVYLKALDCRGSGCPYVALQRMWQAPTNIIYASGIFLVQKSEGGSYLMDNNDLPVTDMNSLCPNCKNLLSNHFCTKVGGAGVPCQPTDTIQATSIADCIAQTITQSPIKGTFKAGCQ